ncbi:MAG: hypothetical protein AB7F53_06790 [Nitrososphaeraceae archaeon]
MEGTLVQIEEGGYIIEEEIPNFDQLEDLNVDISNTVDVDPNSDCRSFIDQNNVFQNANATILAGESHTCTLINTIHVEDIEVPPITDTEPPYVLSFTAHPSRMSFSDGSTITITAHVTDATGFQRVGVFVQDECGGSPGFYQSFELPRITGTPTDGTYQRAFTFPQSALDVNYFCNPNLAFQIGGLVSDTPSRYR